LIAALGGKKISEGFCQFFNITGLAFPDDENFPAGFLELSSIFFVTFFVCIQFRKPISGSTFGRSPSKMASMPMPPAAVNKYNFPMFR
jgi:hypothetical protein